MASYPYARVAHLTGLSLAPYMQAPYAHKSTTTPTTITRFKGLDGCARIHSYGLLIASERVVDGRTHWYVHDRNSSQTTNRHIGAVVAILDANGYKPRGIFEQETGNYMQLYTREEA